MSLGSCLTSNFWESSLVFNPGKGIHALNTLKGTPDEYLIGTVDQEMECACGDLDQIRFRMPANTSVQHKRENRPGFDELEDEFSFVEDPLFPLAVMFKTPEKIMEDPNAQNM